ncbi:MAG: transcription elongation factor GreA [Chloroflexi bacterium]|nr:transcription elongation factor GreA [Chloroflexota bacterium]
MAQQQIHGKMPMTAAGKAALEEELEYLRTVRRPELAEWVKSAREAAHGDLADAAELGEAQREQALVEGRIAELARALAEAEVVSLSPHHGVVALGATVTVRDEEGVDAFTIVGPVEAAVKAGRISGDSPVGHALLGHRAGDAVEVETPAGRRRLEILKVE